MVRAGPFGGTVRKPMHSYRSVGTGRIRPLENAKQGSDQRNPQCRMPDRPGPESGFSVNVWPGRGDAARP
jgi:hypothetical protein